jgi:hypothetical protein
MFRANSYENKKIAEFFNTDIIVVKILSIK